jgi:GTPase Era involved in 16S rRNA processing
MEAMKADTDNRGGIADSRYFAAKLDRAASALRDSTDNASLVGRFESLRERLLHNRLQLAVLGQFKRGKSTFINALLGAPVLPMAVVPLTAVPIFISWGSAASVRVRFQDNRPTEKPSENDPDTIREFLFRFVAEEANPENRLGVDRVDLFYPAPILADETVVIDTPGVGSTFRHNTEAALQVLPECDVALFIVSPDPPITGAELEYLRRLKSRMINILFVLNKADYVRADERVLVESFLRNVLKQNSLWSPGTVIFNVSSRDALDAKQHGDLRELESSGLVAIEDHLKRYLAREKTRTLAQAIATKAEDIVSEAIAELDLRTRTLEMPLEQLTSKLALFEGALRSVEEQRRVLHDLLAGEQRRLVADLRSRADDLYESICAKLPEVIDQELAIVWPPAWTEAAQKKLATAMETSYDSAREQFICSFSADANSSFSAHQRRLEQLINDVRRAAAEIFEVQFHRTLEDTAFELTNDPYWVTLHVRETLIPDPSGLVDRLLPGKLRQTRLRDRVISRTKELVLRNTGSLHWAILQSLNDTFRRADWQFEERLIDAIRATRAVIEATLERRRVRSFDIEPEIARFGVQKAGLLACREEFIAMTHADGGRAPSATDGSLCDASQPQQASGLSAQAQRATMC